MDFGARNYDPALGRWMNVDALADRPEQIFMSPYQYGWNNPIYYTDPDGNCPKCWDFIQEYASGAWSTGANLAIGIATTQYNNAVNAVNSTKAVAGPLLEGDVSGAAKAYAKAVYETSGAKGLVETGKEAASGDAKAIGSLVTIGVAAYVGAKAGGGKSATSEGTTLHRGVNSTSPGISKAKKGTAKPRGGNATPLEHNTVTTESQFTSWTTDIRVAENFALRTSGEGVVLTKRIPKSQLVKSPNKKVVNLRQSPGTIVSESEVLVKGKVTGANVRYIND